MRTGTLPGGRELSPLAERQMRTWALRLQAQQNADKAGETAPVQELVHPYLAISRETGVNAREVAAAVAARCGWKLLDREILDQLAEHEHFSRIALDFVDERTVSWFHEVFGKWLDQQLVSQAEYVSRLGRLVLLAAQHESTVFVGRGAQFLLPRERGVAVRIVAPRRLRIENIKTRRQCSAEQARTFLEVTDNDRAKFVQRYFHRDVADPLLYDFTINLEFVPREVAVDMIVSECKRRLMIKAAPLHESSKIKDR
jgi:cytidylate kinase